MIEKGIPKDAKMHPAMPFMALVFDVAICFYSKLFASMPACLDASWPLNGLGGCREALTINITHAEIFINMHRL